MRLAWVLGASLVAMPTAAAIAPVWLLPETPVPVPLGGWCGLSAGPTGLNCARIVEEGAGLGGCAPVPGGQQCPFEVSIVVEAYWWKNTGGMDVSLTGDCRDSAVAAWEGLLLEREEEARCGGTFFVPAGGCGEASVTARMTFAGSDAPEDRETRMGMGLCLPG